MTRQIHIPTQGKGTEEERMFLSNAFPYVKISVWEGQFFAWPGDERLGKDILACLENYRSGDHAAQLDNRTFPPGKAKEWLGNSQARTPPAPTVVRNCCNCGQALSAEFLIFGDDCYCVSYRPEGGSV